MEITYVNQKEFTFGKIVWQSGQWTNLPRSWSSIECRQPLHMKDDESCTARPVITLKIPDI